MAMSSNAPKHTNWWLWGGIAVAAVVVLGGLGYWFDWFGSEAIEAIAPIAEEAAPVTD